MVLKRSQFLKMPYKSINNNYFSLEEIFICFSHIILNPIPIGLFLSIKDGEGGGCFPTPPP